jgi:hypothetical protein
MTEKPTNKALVIVRITNENRLNADITEDFFLIDQSDEKQYMRAIRIIHDIQANSTLPQTLADVKRKLDENKIDYEHVIDGTRIFLGDVGKDEEEA